MNIEMQIPKNRTRIVDVLEYNGRFYTAEDLGKILKDFELTENTLFAFKEAIMGEA